MYGKLLATISLSLSVTARTVSIDHHKRAASSQAVYFLDNDPAGSSVVSLQIDGSGLLSSPTRTSTGGLGQYGTTFGNVEAGPDSLFSQDAVVVKDNFLFTVNAGSNTLAMFTIDDANPSNLTLIGEPADTLGEFPMSVAYCAAINTVCVLNGGATAGVSCFATDSVQGLTPLDDAIRSIPLGQTTPPFGPVGAAGGAGTTSDLLFNPSCTALFATVKAAAPTLGEYYIWTVDGGSVNTTAKTQQISDMFAVFAMDFEGSDSQLLVVDASYGASILEVSSDFDLTETAHIVVSTQVVNCWSVYSALFNSSYLFDGGAPVVTVLDPVTGNITSQINLDAAATGAFDSAIGGNFLYIAGGDSTIEVIDLSQDPAAQVQSLDLSAIGSRQGWEGLAVYPSS